MKIERKRKEKKNNERKKEEKNYCLESQAHSEGNLMPSALSQLLGSH